MVKCLFTMWETWVQSLGQEELLEKEMATHSRILAGKSHGRRNLVSYSPWGCKESDTIQRLHFPCMLESTVQKTQFRMSQVCESLLRRKDLRRNVYPMTYKLDFTSDK